MALEVPALCLVQIVVVNSTKLIQINLSGLNLVQMAAEFFPANVYRVKEYIVWVEQRERKDKRKKSNREDKKEMTLARWICPKFD